MDIFGGFAMPTPTSRLDLVLSFFFFDQQSVAYSAERADTLVLSRYGVMDRAKGDLLEIASPSVETVLNTYWHDSHLANHSIVI